MKLAAAQLKNRLSGKKVHSVSKSLRSPKQSIGENRIVPLPVILAVAFAKRQARDKQTALINQARRG